MPAFIVRRILIAVPLLIAVMFAAFMLLWLLPGDPTEALLGEKWTPEAAERIREIEGLNDPLHVQFGRYLEEVVLHGDLGTDQRNRSIANALKTKIPATMELALLAMLIAVVLGVSAGILSALKPGSWRDMFMLTAALGGVSFPIFWLALLAKRTFRKGGTLSDLFGFDGMPQAGRLSESFQAHIDQMVDRGRCLCE